MLSDISLFIGKLVFGYLIIKALFLFFLKLKPKRDLIKIYGKDSWAVISGGSDGIGKGFAKRLAIRGFNIVLIARNLKKLEEVKSELVRLNQTISVKVIVADFNLSNEAGFFEKIYNEIKTLDVSILVNNVGVALIEHFSHSGIEKVKELLTVNTAPQLLLTKMLVEQMNNRNRSAVINVSSMAGVHPLPYDSIYSATKAFSDFLSQSFSGEYKKIDFISLRPFFVSTKMVFNRDKDLITITPEECAEGCFEDLGYKSATYGHYKHAIQGFVYDLIPDSVIIMALRFIGPFIAKDFAEKNSKLNKKE